MSSNQLDPKAKADAEAKAKADAEAKAKVDAEAKAKVDAEAKAKADAAAKNGQSLLIKSKSENGFRRCGQGFTREGDTFSCELFSKADIERLLADPNLIVKAV